MAEGFANHYGRDVLQAQSRGLSPTAGIVGETVATMSEKNIDVSRHVPRPYDPLEAESFDIVVNMSAYTLPGKPHRDLREWTVEDPYGRSPAVYQRVSSDLEQRVMRLILELRRPARTK